MVESMYGVDEVDIQTGCFGCTHFWCLKCGLYRRLNPKREHLLNKRGTGSFASKFQELADRGGRIETVSYPNGAKYVGEIRNGKKHGIGTFTFAGGNEHSGKWEDDKFFGEG